MLTRLEVDGFKNLLKFELDFGPFTCVAGPNGVGKSNLFDAIRFLSLLADHTLIEAALLVRGTGSESASGDLRDLFWAGKGARRGSIRMAAQMIVEPEVRDDFGRPAEATSTYLRYEIEVSYEPPDQRGMLGRLVLTHESLTHITEGEAAGREGAGSLRFPHSASAFRRKAVHNKRRSHAGFISTQQGHDGQTEIVVHQDGGSRGPGTISPAARAPRTIVATSNTSATPTILAARREMQKWKFLALEPSAMRNPDRFHTEPFVTANGGHLPATINRLVRDADQRGEDRAAVLGRIATRLAQLVPVSDISIDVDEARQLLTLYVTEPSGVRLPAASLSDGTLRVLTLVVLLSDPEARGLICIEEPENGIHPAKLDEMVDLLRELAVDPNATPGADNPFRQVIVATHSPGFVQLQNAEDLVFATEARVRGADDTPARTLRCRPLAGTWRARVKPEDAVGKGSILAYLSDPPGAQLQLPTLRVAG
ncbi:MAG TPA: AAA family ATPase [Thermoanaerobaculia bacterium]|nr:AAA family ATPase [Thermoanaerobaculia bacterium]